MRIHPKWKRRNGKHSWHYRSNLNYDRKQICQVWGDCVQTQSSEKRRRFRLMLAALNLPNKHADPDEPINHTINMEAFFIWVWGLMQSSGKFYKKGLSPPPRAGFVVVCWPRTEPDVTSYASNIHTLPHLPARCSVGVLRHSSADSATFSPCLWRCLSMGWGYLAVYVIL